MKRIELAGLGTLNITPIGFKDALSTNVDEEGNELLYKLTGDARVGKYFRKDGTEVSKSQVKKRFDINGEQVVMDKLKPTTKIDADVISVGEQDNAEYYALDRKLYAVIVQSAKIKEELEAGKQISFPLVVGAGYKVWKGVVKKHNTQSGKSLYVMFAVRGNMDNAFEQFVDEPIELELGVMPEQNKQNVNKVFASIGC